VSIALLARSFPSLEHAAGVDPWNPADRTTLGARGQPRPLARF
jgi:hypothetical protein